MLPLDITEILRYVPKLRDKIIVLVIKEKAIECECIFNILLDIAFLHNLNIKPLIILDIDEKFTYNNSVGENRNSGDIFGVDSTDALMLKKASEKSFKYANLLLKDFSRLGMLGVISNVVKANPIGVYKGEEMGFSGKIDNVNTDALLRLIDQNVIPIILPIAYSGSNQILRVSSNKLASEISSSLKAVKIIYIMTNSPWINITKSRAVSTNKFKEKLSNKYNKIVKNYKQGKNVSKDKASEISFYRSVTEVMKVCDEGVHRVHFINIKSQSNNILLSELFSNTGIGFMLHADPYKQIRSIDSKDVVHLLALIKTAVDANEMVNRQAADIEKNIEDYYVLEIDDNIIGCIALHCYNEKGKNKLAEVACLHVKAEHKNLGYGKTLVDFAIKHAREIKCDGVFALSTQTSTYFTEKLGFVLNEDINILPQSRLIYAKKSHRNSKLVFKKL